MPDSPDIRHILLWSRHLMKLVPHDLIRETIARSVVVTYTAVVRTQRKALAAEPGSSDAGKLWTQLAALQNHLHLNLRLLGLKPGKIRKRHDDQTEAGDIFTAPRPERPSEQTVDEPFGEPAAIYVR